MAVLELWKKVEAHQFNPPSTKLAHLAESKYLTCDHFTLVDLHHLPNVQYLLGELDQEAV
ncbi:hypothetical protein Gogos_010351 [Gossypium gossypioides]|uniref:glutathione transferase n=1 Tax=Gossypium gossypioides TaxID=34282 RepID=A0A7J9BKY3_GOSGO|nr:hypothetical protein [Gossypium gossypioides]